MSDLVRTQIVVFSHAQAQKLYKAFLGCLIITCVLVVSESSITFKGRVRIILYHFGKNEAPSVTLHKLAKISRQNACAANSRIYTRAAKYSYSQRNKTRASAR